MGPGEPTNGWPTGFPYVNFYTDADWITKPVVAELIRASDFVAVARTRVMLIDKRRDPSINPNAGPSVLQKLT